MVLEYKLLAKNMLFNKVFFFLLAISRFFFRGGVSNFNMFLSFILSSRQCMISLFVYFFYKKSRA